VAVLGAVVGGVLGLMLLVAFFGLVAFACWAMFLSRLGRSGR
jgi:hypothetical protein